MLLSSLLLKNFSWTLLPSVRCHTNAMLLQMAFIRACNVRKCTCRHCLETRKQYWNDILTMSGGRGGGGNPMVCLFQGTEWFTIWPAGSTRGQGLQHHLKSCSCPGIPSTRNYLTIHRRQCKWISDSDFLLADTFCDNFTSRHPSASHHQMYTVYSVYCTCIHGLYNGGRE
jgi:hypothetical protein